MHRAEPRCAESSVRQIHCQHCHVLVLLLMINPLFPQHADVREDEAEPGAGGAEGHLRAGRLGRGRQGRPQPHRGHHHLLHPGRAQSKLSIRAYQNNDNSKSISSYEHLGET